MSLGACLVTLLLVTVIVHLAHVHVSGNYRSSNRWHHIVVVNLMYLLKMLCVGGVIVGALYYLAVRHWHHRPRSSPSSPAAV